MANKYIMISLEDEKAKLVAEVLSNKTAKEILKYLAEKEASESDIAEALKLNLNTVEYNLNKLIEAGFIKSEKFLWSSKGRKIDYYKLANKSILISPKSSLAKSVIPVAIISAVGAYIVYFFTRARIIKEAIRPEFTENVVEKSAGIGATQANELVAYFSSLPAWAWFLLGAWLGLVIFLIWNWRKL